MTPPPPLRVLERAVGRCDGPAAGPPASDARWSVQLAYHPVCQPSCSVWRPVRAGVGRVLCDRKSAAAFASRGLRWGIVAMCTAFHPGLLGITDAPTRLDDSSADRDVPALAQRWGEQRRFIRVIYRHTSRNEPVMAWPHATPRSSSRGRALRQFWMLLFYRPVPGGGYLHGSATAQCGAGAASPRSTPRWMADALAPEFRPVRRSWAWSRTYAATLIGRHHRCSVLAAVLAERPGGALLPGTTARFGPAGRNL